MITSIIGSECNQSISCSSLGLNNQCCSSDGWCGKTLDYCFPISCINQCQDIPSECGDNLCTLDENCSNCPDDCGSCLPNTIYTKCENNLEYALTFDDGPSPATNDLLDILQNKSAPATFFVVGEMIIQNNTILKRIINDGHIVLVHTYDHRNLSSLSSDDITREIYFNEMIIRQNECKRIPRLYRPPYGEYNNLVDEITTNMGYQNVLWNLDTLDWQDVAKINGTDIIVNRTKFLIDDLYPTGIIHLQHDLVNTSIQSVPEIIDYIRSKGYKIVSLDKCLGITNFSLWDNWFESDPKTCFDTYGHSIGGGSCETGFDCNNWNGACIDNKCQCYLGWTCSNCELITDDISFNTECPKVVSEEDVTSESHTYTLLISILIMFVSSLY